MMNFFFFLLASVFSLHCMAEQESAPELAFTKLKTLTGQWQKAGSDGDGFFIRFETTAKGSVLVEHWMYQNSSHSMTLYHLDGDALLATHYCPQGNQPRLQLTQATSGQQLAFTFRDATNLINAEASHQHSLAFDLVNENTLIRRETYLKAGQVSESSLRLVRQ